MSSSHSIYEKFQKKIIELHLSLTGILKIPSFFFKLLSLNIFFQILRVLQIHILFLGFNISPSWIFELSFVPLIILISLMPFTYYGLGIKENAFIYFFALTSIPNEISVSVSIISYILFLPGIIIGAILFLFDKKQLSSALKQNLSNT